MSAPVDQLCILSAPVDQLRILSAPVDQLRIVSAPVDQLCITSAPAGELVEQLLTLTNTETPVDVEDLCQLIREPESLTDCTLHTCGLT